MLIESDMDNDNQLSFAEFQHLITKTPDFFKFVFFSLYFTKVYLVLFVINFISPACFFVSNNKINLSIKHSYSCIQCIQDQNMMEWNDIQIPIFNSYLHHIIVILLIATSDSPSPTFTIHGLQNTIPQH